MHVHDPRTIAAIPDFTAVNGALAVDLWGQVAAETTQGRMRAPGGGQMDFMRAAQLSPGGRSIVMLAARDAKTGASRIVHRLPPGELVTTHRADVDYVVTEFGVAALRGTTMEERARRIAAIAHPDHRNALTLGRDPGS
jgi:acyl-CoA hydrolase